MPRKKETPARSLAPAGAAALIAKAKGFVSSIPAPSGAALAELRTILAHNDQAPQRERVPMASAIELLNGMGWTGRTDTALNTLCVRVLGRRSYARP